MEKDIKELKMYVESKQNEINLKQQEVEQGQEQVVKYERMLQDQKELVEKATKELEMVNQKVIKLHSDLEDQIHANTQLLAENSQKQLALKIKDDEIQAVKDEVVRFSKIREASLLKIKAAETAKEEVEVQNSKLQNEIQGFEREVEVQKRNVERERKRHEDLLRERDMLSKMKTKAESSIEKQADLMRINEVAIHNLETEIMSYRDASDKQEKIIQQLERERQKYSVEASQSGVKYIQALDELKAREVTIIDLQKKIVDCENRLKQQQSLYESVRSQRNTYSKNLVDAQDEIEMLKRRMKIMNNQIERLKEEVDTKELALTKEHLEFTKVKALSEELENPLNVHRWRQLEGTDPTAFQMILKIQTLQKRLILKAEQVVEKDLLIQEKEKLYDELQHILARQPGPEIMEQLSLYRNNANEKTRQMQAMQAELHMYQEGKRAVLPVPCLSSLGLCLGTWKQDTDDYCPKFNEGCWMWVSWIIIHH